MFSEQDLCAPEDAEAITTAQGARSLEPSPSPPPPSLPSPGEPSSPLPGEPEPGEEDSLDALLGGDDAAPGGSAADGDAEAAESDPDVDGEDAAAAAEPVTAADAAAVAAMVIADAAAAAAAVEAAAATKLAAAAAAAAAAIVAAEAAAAAAAGVAAFAAAAASAAAADAAADALRPPPSYAASSGELDGNYSYLGSSMGGSRPQSPDVDPALVGRGARSSGGYPAGNYPTGFPHPLAEEEILSRRPSSSASGYGAADPPRAATPPTAPAEPHHNLPLKRGQSVTPPPDNRAGPEWTASDLRRSDALDAAGGTLAGRWGDAAGSVWGAPRSPSPVSSLRPSTVAGGMTRHELFKQELLRLKASPGSASGMLAWSNPPFGTMALGRPNTAATVDPLTSIQQGGWTEAGAGGPTANGSGAVVIPARIICGSFLDPFARFTSSPLFTAHQQRKGRATQSQLQQQSLALSPHNHHALSHTGRPAHHMKEDPPAFVSHPDLARGWRANRKVVQGRLVTDGSAAGAVRPVPAPQPNQELLDRLGDRSVVYRSEYVRIVPPTSPPSPPPPPGQGLPTPMQPLPAGSPPRGRYTRSESPTEAAAKRSVSPAADEAAADPNAWTFWSMASPHGGPSTAVPDGPSHARGGGGGGGTRSGGGGGGGRRLGGAQHGDGGGTSRGDMSNRGGGSQLQQHAMPAAHGNGGGVSVSATWPFRRILRQSEINFGPSGNFSGPPPQPDALPPVSDARQTEPSHYDVVSPRRGRLNTPPAASPRRAATAATAADGFASSLMPGSSHRGWLKGPHGAGSRTGAAASVPQLSLPASRGAHAKVRMASAAFGIDAQGNMHAAVLAMRPYTAA